MVDIRLVIRQRSASNQHPDLQLQAIFRIRHGQHQVVHRFVVRISFLRMPGSYRWLHASADGPRVDRAFVQHVDASMVAEFARLRILLFPSEFSRIRLRATSKTEVSPSNFDFAARRLVFRGPGTASAELKFERLTLGGGQRARACWRSGCWLRTWLTAACSTASSWSGLTDGLSVTGFRVLCTTKSGETPPRLIAWPLGE
jgi:hypothetical protein